MDMPCIKNVKIVYYSGTGNTRKVAECFANVLNGKGVETDTFAGADIRDLVVTPVLRSDGSISAYRASGNIYSLWNNGTAVLYGFVSFTFGADETSKNMPVTSIVLSILPVNAILLLPAYIVIS